MFVDRRNFDGEKFCQRLLRQLHRFFLEENIHLHRPVRRGVEQKFILIAHTLISVSNPPRHAANCMFFEYGWLGLHFRDSLFIDGRRIISTGDELSPVDYFRFRSTIPSGYRVCAYWPASFLISGVAASC